MIKIRDGTSTADRIEEDIRAIKLSKKEKQKKKYQRERDHFGSGCHRPDVWKVDFITAIYI